MLDLSLDGERLLGMGRGTRGSGKRKIYKAMRPIYNVPGAVFGWGFPLTSPHRPKRTRKQPGFFRLKWDSSLHFSHVIRNYWASG